MKKMISIVLVIVVLVTLQLAGCSGNNSKSDDSSATSSQSTSQENSSSQTDSSDDKPVTVTMLSWENETAMKPLLDAFKAKHPNITIDFQFVPPVKDYVQKLKTTLLTDSAADVFVMALENKEEIMKSGYAMDISDQPFISTLSDFNKETYSYDGKVYGYAQSAWAGGIFYNKKLFAKVNAEVPKTWKEFLDVCKKLKDAGITPYLENFQDAAVNIVTGLFITETHAKNKNFDEEVNAGTKKYVDGWTIPAQLWYNDLVKTGYMTKDMLGVSWDQQQIEFATEKVAMSPGGPWCVPIFLKANPDLDFGLMPWPGVEENNRHWSGSAGIAYTINAKTQVKDAALKLLEFMSTPEGLVLYYEGTGQLISAKGAEYTVHPALEDAKNGLNDIWNPMAGWKYPEAIRNQLLVSLQDCFAGKYPPEQVAIEMDKKLAEMQNN